MGYIILLTLDELDPSKIFPMGCF